MEEKFPSYEDFEDSLVGFIDLLGFDQRVRAVKSSTDFFEVGKLLYTIKVTADNLNYSGDILKNFKFTAISDSLIVSVPFKDPICTVGLLHLLHNIQYELVATSFQTLVRGYINRGPIYHKDGLLFGAGYSGAYKGEGMIGNAPRIVLSPDVVKDAKRVIGNYSGKKKMITALDFLQEDKSDGFYFIDYLKPVGNQLVLPKQQLMEERNQIKEFIKDNLSKFSTDYQVLPKYKWLENYFNISSLYFTDGKDSQ
jgi:hypothetical protein